MTTELEPRITDKQAGYLTALWRQRGTNALERLGRPLHSVSRKHAAGLIQEALDEIEAYEQLAEQPGT